MNRRLVLLILVLLLVVVAIFTLRSWAPPFFQFLGANADTIQALQSLIQILLWLAAATVFLLGARNFREGSKSSTWYPPESDTTVLQSIQGLVAHLSPQISRLGLGDLLDYRIDGDTLLIHLKTECGIRIFSLGLSKVWHMTPSEIAQLLADIDKEP